MKRIYWGVGLVLVLAAAAGLALTMTMPATTPAYKGIDSDIVNPDSGLRLRLYGDRTGTLTATASVNPAAPTPTSISSSRLIVNGNTYVLPRTGPECFELTLPLGWQDGSEDVRLEAVDSQGLRYWQVTGLRHR